MNNNEKTVKILITDIQLHSTKNSNPQTFKRKIEKSIKSGKDGRCFGGKVTVKDGVMEFELYLPKEACGKNIRYILPANIPIAYGKDAIEKIKSLKNKGII